MQYGQLIKYNKNNIFLQKSCRKCVMETTSRPAFVFKKALFEWKESALQLGFNIFR